MFAFSKMAVLSTDSVAGRYRPLLELGRGGMARVYLAESLSSGLLRKLVVVKVLNQELAADPEMRRSFIREAEISSRLNHPNIGNVTEVFEQGTTAMMVMQYLEGLTLSEIASRLKGAIPLKLHLNILSQVLGALHYFHELKDTNGASLETVHRDVSPDNVMVLHEGGVKVVDFGVAKVRVENEHQTRAGVIKGKVAYMPPEQLLSSASVDRRADIYSVGVMLWEAVAGRRMWRGMDASARMRAIIKGELPSIREAAPGVSDALATIVERALAHTPDGRYATAEEMQIELEQVTLTQGGHTGPRELAEFMRANFGEERSEKQREIAKVVGDRDYSLAEATVTFSESPSVIADRSSVLAAQAAPTVQSTPPARWPKALMAAAIVSVGAGLAFTFSGPSSPVASQMEPALAAPTSVTLRIDSGKAGEEVYVDGVKVGVTPLVQSRPASSQSATIELRDDGQVVDSKVVSLQNDVEVRFTTRPDAQRPAPESEDPQLATGADSEPAHQAPEQERRPTSARQRRPARAAEAARENSAGAKAAPAAPAAPKASSSDSCDPPYRIDPGGVKVFKPHCF
jgi:serine/threonine protein kinase